MSSEGDRETASPARDMVTVGQFESPLEAQMAKGMLESAGIECLLAGEEANSLLQAAFVVSLQVGEQDEAAALQLLARVDESPESDSASKLN
jgi:hypothetical protein